MELGSSETLFHGNTLFPVSQGRRGDWVHEFLFSGGLEHSLVACFPGGGLEGEGVVGYALTSMAYLSSPSLSPSLLFSLRQCFLTFSHLSTLAFECGQPCTTGTRVIFLRAPGCMVMKTTFATAL